MHCPRMEDAAQAFVELGTLIIEGRLPAEKTDRGYKEGPHCYVAASPQNIHHCNPNDFLCKRAERLRKHMHLLANSTSHMCVEVLLCPTCQCGIERARNPEFANIPSSSDLLLEQWTVSIAHIKEMCNMSGRGLFQAVRSQLHFSQLSAWWSSTKGACPTNVYYRVTMAEEAFASHFSKPPQQHSFPSANAGPNSQLKVSVRTLPRCESIPNVRCEACIPPINGRKRSTGLDQPLLGESLLDPPGPSSSWTHDSFDISNWYHSVPPSPPRRRASRQTLPIRDREHTSTRHILPLPGPVDDRMQTTCNQRGKHDCRCEDDIDEFQSKRQKHNETTTNKINLDLSKKEMEEVLTVLRVQLPDSMNITSQADKVTGKGDLLLSAILRTSQTRSPTKLKTNKNTRYTSYIDLDPIVGNMDLKRPSDLSVNSIKTIPKYKNSLYCCETKENQNLIEFKNLVKHQIKKENTVCLSCEEEEIKLANHNSNGLKKNGATSLNELTTSSEKIRLSPERTVPVDKIYKEVCQNAVDSLTQQMQKTNLGFVDNSKNTVDSIAKEVPSAHDKAKFRRSLDCAASIFHWRTGLPLTSSPAPLRRASHRFDFDSSINSVKAIRSALFDGEGKHDVDEDETCKFTQFEVSSSAGQYQSPGSSLLGSFEESVLNGRLEPVSTVHGFTADLGASGSFCPPHLVLPVTVFFYTLGDIDKVSSPYLAHMHLGKKGYLVPRVGTIQVTLMNPLGTVIKMFVIMYNLMDMPNSSHTFLRQRTLYMPNAMSEPVDIGQKYLRYLIHLRFATSKSGKLSLHTDIRMIILRKSDMDTATGHELSTVTHQLCSFTHGPTNPKFSPRK